MGNVTHINPLSIMNIYRQIAVVMLFTLINGCAIKERPVTKSYSNIDKYEFVAIPSTNIVSSSGGSVYGNQYGVYGATSSKVMNPSSLIEGLMLKKGLTSVNEITPKIEDKTLIVRYGQSGRRDVLGGLGGYTLEVTIKIISAATYESVYTCTAEGQGETEVDDIRDAITRCLSDF